MSRPAAAVESLVVAPSGFAVAELKPARGNCEELERPSDICEEKERPIESLGFIYYAKEKEMTRERRVKNKKKGPREKTTARRTAAQSRNSEQNLSPLVRRLNEANRREKMLWRESRFQRQSLFPGSRCLERSRGLPTLAENFLP